MIKTTMYLSEDQMKELEATAKRQARPKVNVIREALADYFARQLKCVPQSRGIFEDRELDSSNIDEWLKENWRPE